MNLLQGYFIDELMISYLIFIGDLHMLPGIVKD